jgi:hypothetical protein
MELKACKEEKVRHRTKDLQTLKDLCRKLREYREQCMVSVLECNWGKNRLQDAPVELKENSCSCIEFSARRKLGILAGDSALTSNPAVLQ